MTPKRRWPLYLLQGRSRAGYPIATVAFYGPDDQRASKVVASIVPESGGVTALERWFSDVEDVREDETIGRKVLAFIRAHGARKIVITEGNIGCPHEEGIDYPEGGACPRCPFWKGRDRWTGKVIVDRQ